MELDVVAFTNSKAFTGMLCQRAWRSIEASGGRHFSYKNTRWKTTASSADCKYGDTELAPLLAVFDG